jgi:hypothetical protein
VSEVIVRFVDIGEIVDNNLSESSITNATTDINKQKELTKHQKGERRHMPL